MAMSKGVRIYVHRKGQPIERRGYNVGTGVHILWRMRQGLAGDGVGDMRLVAVGCEEGAMVAHFMWERER